MMNLCRFRADAFDASELVYATPGVLGQLFYNRVAAIAYGVLTEGGFADRVPREFRNSVRMAYEANAMHNESYFRCLAELSGLLADNQGQYAMLKGAVLCKTYPTGYRTANDVDLLVHPAHLTEIESVLRKNGFIQGYIRNGQIQPASRAEIIGSRMMRGETVPYVREVNLPGMRFLEVDLNFSLGYSNGDDGLVADMLQRSIRMDFGDFSVCTLCREDFFLHLCAHLHKEASTIAWVRMRRDMTLYKYCDIYLMLGSMDREAVDVVFSRAKALGLLRICCYAIVQTCRLLDVCNPYAYRRATECPGIEDFLHIVVAPSERKKYRYQTENLLDRFFLDSRIDDLIEVNDHE